MGCFIQRFLSHRCFLVRLENYLAGSFSQENGIPQGGVLGVAPFAVMINYICDELSAAIGRSLYVDDLAVWYMAASTRLVSRQLQIAMSCIEKLNLTNGLRFSTVKTVAVHSCHRCC